MKRNFIAVAVVAAGITAAAVAAPTVSAEPTYGEGAELVKEVRDRGILQQLPDFAIVDALRSICDSAISLARYGYTADDLADIWRGSYRGLSQKDARWLMSAALPKCG